MAKLSLDSFVQVEAVNEWGHIPEIDAYGPFGRRMIRADKLMNMLNRNLDVRLSDTNAERMFLLVSEYNLMVSGMGPDDPQYVSATMAENVLSTRLRRTVAGEARERAKENPFENPTDSDLDTLASRIYDSSTVRSVLDDRKKSRKPRIHDLFKNVDVQSGWSTDEMLFGNLDLSPKK